MLIDNLAGQIVGVVFFSGSSTAESGKMLNVKYTSQTSARYLVDTEGSHNVTDPQVLLVRRTLAWITGIILLISTLLGVRLDIDKGLVAFLMQIEYQINTGALCNTGSVCALTCTCAFTVSTRLDINKDLVAFLMQ